MTPRFHPPVRVGDMAEREDLADGGPHRAQTHAGIQERGHALDRGLDDVATAVRLEGTLVVVGSLDPRPAPFPGKPLTIHRYRSFEHTLDPAVVKRMAAFLNAGVRLGTVRPAVGQVFTLGQVADAHRRLEAGSHDGKKVVVTVAE